MKFEKGKLYTHRNMLDCIIHVLGPVYQDSEGYVLKVSWWVRAGYSLNMQETISIKRSDLQHWYEWKE